MEITQREKNAFELCLFGACLESLLVKVVERFVKIGLHAGRGFVGDLDGGFEDALRDDVLLWKHKGELEDFTAG